MSEKKQVYNSTPKLDVRYYSKKKDIHGLTIRGSWNGNYCVIEDTTPDLDMFKRKTVFKGSLAESRDYVKKRLNSSKFKTRRTLKEMRRK